MRAFPLLCFALTAGCLPAGPRLSPAVAGCYAVHGQLTPEQSRVTGFKRLPDVIALDTTEFGRILVPDGWKHADRPAVNQGTLEVFSYDWSVQGDSLLLAPSKPHALGADSIIVRFAGWGGELVTYLERDAAGFRGAGFLYPRQLAAGMRSVPVELRPSGCRPDLT